MSNRRGQLVIVSGPTASGKSTLWRRLVSHPQVRFSVSATTRAPRANETNGRDYHFVDDARFDQMIAQGELLEWAEVHGHRYGTPRGPVVKAIDAGFDVVLEIDVQGAIALRESGLPTISIFVAPPSREELEQRLRDRGTETEAQMAKRLAIVEQEMAASREYDHVVVNDDLERMIDEVEILLNLQPHEG
jgi:guanylate kinase